MFPENTKAICHEGPTLKNAFKDPDCTAFLRNLKTLLTNDLFGTIQVHFETNALNSK